MNVGLPACMCTTFMPITRECYERVLNPLQLEFKAGMSGRAGVGS